jgi:hypothetical protein
VAIESVDDQIGPAAVLRGLTDFTVRARFQLRRTVLDIHQPGRREPVARMVKPTRIYQPVAYELFTGSSLDELAGHLTTGGAVGPDGTTIGIVNRSGGRIPDAAVHPLSGVRQPGSGSDPRFWRVAQLDLPPLTGRVVGLVTWLCFNWITSLLGWLGLIVWPRMLVPLTFDFRGPDGRGFRVMTAGWYRARVTVRVDDPRVERRLVLACVAAVVLFFTEAPRRDLVNLMAPFAYLTRTRVDRTRDTR